MPDPVASVGLRILIAGGKALAAKYDRLPSKALAEAEGGELDFIGAVVERLRLLENRTEGIGEELARLMDDRPTQTILGNLGFEALREALEERRFMLAVAAAGILHPRFTTERRARIERKLRDLDHDDVRHLAGISCVPAPEIIEPASQPGVRNDHHAMARLRYGRARPDQFEALRSSNCVEIVRLANYTGDGLALTRLGSDILLVVEDYVAERGVLPLEQHDETEPR